jgi:hypothetical protein
MIYTQFGLPVAIIRADWREKAPKVPGWVLTCEQTDTSTGTKRTFIRYTHELRADNGLAEIEAAANWCKEVSL